MCHLFANCNFFKVEGLYKVALKNKETKEYYSPATGIKYPLNGEIPKIVEAKRISSYFKENLLRCHFNEFMVGKTAAFEDLEDAVSFAKELSSSLEEDNLKDSWETVILLVTLTDEVYNGMYKSARVFAGKNIDIIKEVDYDRKNQ
jgi:hypothetical protein